MPGQHARPPGQHAQPRPHNIVRPWWAPWQRRCSCGQRLDRTPAGPCALPPGLDTAPAWQRAYYGHLLQLTASAVVLDATTAGEQAPRPGWTAPTLRLPVIGNPQRSGLLRPAAALRRQAAVGRRGAVELNSPPT